MALYEAIFAMMESMIPEFDVFGFIRERTGNIMPGITPSSIHTSADGKHVQIGANAMRSSSASCPPSAVRIWPTTAIGQQ
nr:CoA transferase [Pseudomonas sp. LH1G9]